MLATTTLERDSEFLARVELEIKYVMRPTETKKLFRELYKDVNGKEPAGRLNLLKWFFENYQFNTLKETWYKIEPVLH